MSINQSEQNKDKKNIQLSIDPQTAKGLYSNLVVNNFSSEEFIFDFAMLQPAMTQATINSRVIISPKNTKKLLVLIQENLKKYEAKHGAISLDNSSGGSVSMSFN